MTLDSDKNPAELLLAIKHKTIQNLILENDFLIHFSSHDKSVIVPKYLKMRDSITLKLSASFRGPLELLDDGISAELRFDGTPFFCFVPLKYIWGCTASDDSKHLWDPPDSVVADIQRQLQDLSKKSNANTNQPLGTGKSDNKEAKALNKVRAFPLTSVKGTAPLKKEDSKALNKKTKKTSGIRRVK